MAQTRTVAVELDDRNIQRPWDESDLVTDWSVFPEGYGILLNERLMFPEDLCLWRMKIDTTRQLFVDDHLIAHQRDLKREFHHPDDHPANPLMDRSIPQYFCPDEEHGYRMYYSHYSKLWPLHIAYSRDGLNWEKPDLGIYDGPARSEGPNNVLLEGEMHGLFHHPDDPDPSQRWKAVIRPAGQRANVVRWNPMGEPDRPDPIRGQLYALYTSPDGIHWSFKADMAIPKALHDFRAPYQRPVAVGDMVRARWDPKLKTYIANAKHTIGPDLRMTSIFHAGRVVTVCESDDLIHWSSPRVYAYPDGEDAKIDGMYGIYEADGFPYESMWFNQFCMCLYIPAGKEERKRRNLMPTRPYLIRTWIRLAASRDGRHWTYMGNRRPFIDNGPEDGWKPYSMRLGNQHTVGGPLLKDDRLWFYGHGSMADGPKGDWRIKAGVLTLRRDGFASLNADEEAGVVITRPLVFEGEGKLFVNADVAVNGCVRASVVAEDGSGIEGFGEDDCRAVCEDSTCSRVGWSGNETLAGLKDRYVRLAFHLTNAKLYSFWIE